MPLRPDAAFDPESAGSEYLTLELGDERRLCPVAQGPVFRRGPTSQSGVEARGQSEYLLREPLQTRPSCSTTIRGA